MATVFWDSEGVVLIDFLEGKKLLQAPIEVLRKLRAKLAEKRRGILFHHDNAPAHYSWIVRDVLREFWWELLPHQPYSPDLAPSDLFSQNYLVLTYLLSISTNCQKISIVFLLVVISETLWLTISYMQMIYAVSVLALQDFKIYSTCVIAFLIKMVLFLIVINPSVCSFSLNHFTSRMSL